METHPPIAFALRTMRLEDLPRCLELSRTVGWNQTSQDWQRFWNYDPSGCFVAVVNEKVIGTACTIPYENRFGWVAMVIVDPAFRRMKIGNALLHAGIDHLEQRGLTVKLDATPEGKQLYDTLGFVDEYGLARFQAAALTVPQPEALCEPLSLGQLVEVESFDAPIFGASRRLVLESYLQRYPGLGYCVHKNGKIHGYILAREGINAFHIGPWIAEDVNTAQSLLFALIRSRKPEKIFLDIIEPNPYVRSLLEVLGFKQQRPFIRMYRGQNRYPGTPEKIYSISGPELG